MVGESQEAVGAGVGSGSQAQGSNKTPTLQEYGTNLTQQALEVRAGTVLLGGRRHGKHHWTVRGGSGCYPDCAAVLVRSSELILLPRRGSAASFQLCPATPGWTGDVGAAICHDLMAQGYTSVSRFMGRRRQGSPAAAPVERSTACMVAVRLTCSCKLERLWRVAATEFYMSMALSGCPILLTRWLLVCGEWPSRGGVRHSSVAGAGTGPWCRVAAVPILYPHSLEPDPPPHKHATLSSRSVGQAGPRGRPQEAD